MSFFFFFLNEINESVNLGRYIIVKEQIISCKCVFVNRLGLVGFDHTSAVQGVCWSMHRRPDGR